MSQEDPDRAHHADEKMSASSGKIFAPTSPVDVPRMPARQDSSSGLDHRPPTAAGPDAASTDTAGAHSAGADAAQTHGHAAANAEPVAIDTTKTNWADSTQPAPDKQTARSSIL